MPDPLASVGRGPAAFASFAALDCARPPPLTGKPLPKQPPRAERPFQITEPSFTSGWICQRKYVQKRELHPLEAERADPFHHPNYLDVKEDHHYDDWRARSHHIDPSKRKELPVDKELHLRVHDAEVKDLIRAGTGTKAVNLDREVASILFSGKVRPQAHTVRQLNSDLSCVDFPESENPRDYRKEPSPFPFGVLMPEPEHKNGPWGWCLGGRQPGIPDSMRQPETPPEMRRIASSPTLSRHPMGASMLTGVPDSRPPGNFHGVTIEKNARNPANRIYREFGKSPTRMKGGEKAHGGWAGTIVLIPGQGST